MDAVKTAAKEYGLSKRSVLRPGKRLVIYRGGTGARTGKPRVTQAATRQPAPPPAAGSVHVVRRGDNLWTIARRYRISARSLAQWNRLEWDALLQPGQTLQLGPPESAGADSPAARGYPDSI